MSILKSSHKAIESIFLPLALLEARSKMLEVRNILPDLAQNHHSCGLSRSKKQETRSTTTADRLTFPRPLVHIIELSPPHAARSIFFQLFPFRGGMWVGYNIIPLTSNTLQYRQIQTFCPVRG